MSQPGPTERCRGHRGMFEVRGPDHISLPGRPCGSLRRPAGIRVATARDRGGREAAGRSPVVTGCRWTRRRSGGARREPHGHATGPGDLLTAGGKGSQSPSRAPGSGVSMRGWEGISARPWGEAAGGRWLPDACGPRYENSNIWETQGDGLFLFRYPDYKHFGLLAALCLCGHLGNRRLFLCCICFPSFMRRKHGKPRASQTTHLPRQRRDRQ